MKKQRVDTIYNEPQVSKPTFQKTPQKKLSNNKSKTPTLTTFYLRRKSSVPEISTAASRNTSPALRRGDTMHTESFTCRSPFRKNYSGGSTGIYYEEEAKKILKNAANISLTRTPRREMTSQRSSSAKKSFEEILADSPLKSLHTTRNIHEEI